MTSWDLAVPRPHGLGGGNRPVGAGGFGVPQAPRPERPPLTAQAVRPGNWWRWAFLLLALLPLVGHGCHGDDIDHEPSVPPPVYNQK